VDTDPGKEEQRATRLALLRGNSGSGKSTIARRIRRAGGERLALVSQDVLRREVLGERDRPGGANIDLIEVTVRHALEHGFDVVLEGILYSVHYGDMLRRLSLSYADRVSAFYLDVPFDETCRRHTTRPQCSEFSVEEMREWYQPLDLVPGLDEQIMTADLSAEDVACRMLVALGRSGGARLGSGRPG
jgi:adenylate kinase family enzyme